MCDLQCIKYHWGKFFFSEHFSSLLPIIIPPMLHTHLQESSRALLVCSLKGFTFIPLLKQVLASSVIKLMWELSFCSDVMYLKALKPVPYVPVMILLSSFSFDSFQLILCTLLDTNLICALIILYRMWFYTFHEQLYVAYSFLTLLGFLYQFLSSMYWISWVFFIDVPSNSLLRI